MIAKKYNLSLYLLILPGFLIYLIFFLFPIGQTIFYSLFKWAGFSDKMVWLGFRNYIELFTNEPYFYQTLKNNIYYTIIVVSVQTVAALALALALVDNTRVKRIYKTIFIYPIILSVVHLGITWSFIYDTNIGLLNKLLELLNLDNLKQYWLGDPKIALTSVAFVSIWKNTGFIMIIFIAGLVAIPEELYESAMIEGVNSFQKFIYITLPLLRPALRVAIVLNTIGCFKIFETIFVMTQGGPAHSTEVLATLIYHRGFSSQRIGYASALSVILLIIIGAISFLQLAYFRRKDN